MNNKRSGYVAIVGRPNVGKSTLLNHLLKYKISITSRRPQTTRHAILGIHTVQNAQVVYVDTPGLHTDAKRAMNRYMNRTAAAVLEDVDAVIFVVEATRWTEEDESVLERLKRVKAPVFLAVNKVDQIKDKNQLLPVLGLMSKKRDYQDIVPLSALNGDQVSTLENAVINVLPQGEFLYPDDQITDRSERFLAAEIIREKLTRLLGKEIPYALTVEIEQFEVEDELTTISSIIWVERDGQKAIVIGKGGHMLKKVGELARIDIEAMLGHKVFLRLWVKVREGWSDDERALRSLGYSGS
ncbi:MAG: GTPase Era [Proteobacteria bacterium]|nr:MAG: GTPase Era [Pseudomonadota bacterium]QKK12261.1 MAG: GTPase Era [Pseudomonadota bacterium]